MPAVQEPRLPRFEAVARREFLKRAATVGAIVLVPGALAACSKDDSDVFAGSDSTTSTTTSGGTSPTAGTGSGGDTGDAGSSLPDGAQVEVAFTYAAQSGGGPTRNPFIAVWVESAAGDLVANVSLWYNPPKGDRWIDHLTNWYGAGATGTGDVESVTGPTRAAGAYTVLWDGLDTNGDRAPQGDYVVFVESAREHGPHSLISTTMALGTSALEASFADDGELSAASASYTV